MLRHQHPHDGTVREWLRRGGPLATLPLPAAARGSPGSSARRRRSGWQVCPYPKLLDEFDALTGGVLGRIELESGPAVYPLGAQHARQYVAPRVALVGDAAHGVHPIHAQGFNMGVADVGSLADSLLAARRAASISAPAKRCCPTSGRGAATTRGASG